jgi:hypothetical protein
VRDGVVGDVRGRLTNILTPGSVIPLKARGEGGGGGLRRHLLLRYADGLYHHSEGRKSEDFVWYEVLDKAFLQSLLRKSCCKQYTVECRDNKNLSRTLKAKKRLGTIEFCIECGCS